LFSGISRFHKSLHQLGHNCVFASEIDPVLQKAYKASWGIQPYGDIKKIVKNSIDLIPEHDILCAGFPCQPFSKAGKQEGADDKERGTLFDDILKILKFRTPKFFILENVPHLANHNNEETWADMKRRLQRAGYTVDHELYSPHEFGIPQHRERFFIVGSRIGLDHFDWMAPVVTETSVFDFLDLSPTSVVKIGKDEEECLNLWQEFISAIPTELKLPGFPIWSMEFGATYPYEKQIPQRITSLELSSYKGSFGVSLNGLTKKEQLSLLPSYALVKKKFPNWKQRYIKHNRQFYIDNKKYIKEIVERLSKYQSQSWQKLEWNVGLAEKNLFNYILQFRASGIRVKKTDFFPSLVCTNTQRPILGWEKRYITRNEGLKIQSLEGVILPDNDNAAFRALGNAVNSLIIKKIASRLIIQPMEKINVNKLLNGHSKKINGNHSNSKRKVISTVLSS
jgi:DNA (cytosine-5)-methyltransferase 1